MAEIEVSNVDRTNKVYIICDAHGFEWMVDVDKCRIYTPINELRFPALQCEDPGEDVYRVYDIRSLLRHLVGREAVAVFRYNSVAMLLHELKNDRVWDYGDDR